MKRKFWNWVKNEDVGGRTLYLDGEISDETWYGDEVTPELFRKELELENKSGNREKENGLELEGMMFSRAAVANSLLEKLIPKKAERKGIPAEQLEKRLNLLSH